MYQLVADIPAYAEFLPWCSGARIRLEDGGSVEASIDIAYRAVHQSFTTRNQMTPDAGIEMTLLDGPFSHLHGVWTFSDLGEGGSKIELKLDFDFSNRLLGKLVGPVFKHIANDLVASFCRRAESLYGKN